MNMIGYGKEDNAFGVSFIPPRKKPCLCIQKGNTLTKVASFNNAASAKRFLDFMSDLFNMEKIDWNGHDIPYALCDDPVKFFEDIGVFGKEDRT